MGMDLAAEALRKNTSLKTFRLLVIIQFVCKASSLSAHQLRGELVTWVVDISWLTKTLFHHQTVLNVNVQCVLARNLLESA
jgi:hypothetical protein